MLEITGVCLLALSVALTTWKSLRVSPVRPFSALVMSITGIVAAVLFTLLSPARPGPGVVAALALCGLAVGVGACFTARLRLEKRSIISSHRLWHIVVWLLAMLLSSILVIAGPAASEAAVSISLFFSAGIASYSATLYMRYAARLAKTGV